MFAFVPAPLFPICGAEGFSCRRAAERKHMYDISEFICWALSHIKKESIPAGAELPVPTRRCGTEPWNYLYGSVRVRTTQAMLDLYYKQHYQKTMTRARFDALTANWPRDGFATDCQGLLDAFLTYEKGAATDINADMNYRLWCTEKGGIAEIDRPFAIGEAVFRAGGSGRMEHVGWVCGFAGGEPLIVEALGIASGVVITKLAERNFTHRGIMSAMFGDYAVKPKANEENENEAGAVRFEQRSPMQRGDAFLAMQHALNFSGFTDGDGKALAEDGKWGRRSQSAFLKLLSAHRDLLTK